MVEIEPVRGVDHAHPRVPPEIAESLEYAPLVIWYVPQLKNSDTPGAEYCWADSILQDGVFVPRVWPCAAGPLFVPIGGN